MYVDALVVERGIHFEVALFGIDVQKARSALTIRAAARGENAGGELHGPLHRLLHFGEAPAMVASGHDCGEISGLFSSDVADCVQRVDAEIHQGSASAEFLAEPPRAGGLLRIEAALERFQLANGAGSNHLDGLLPRRVIMHAIADHQLDLCLAAYIDHLATLGA